MIKERHYNVNPNVLTCLLHLRLRTELGLDADGKSRLKGKGRGRDDERQKAKSETRQKWMNKNRRKAEKEKKEVEKEMEEAEAEVDKEERSKVVSTTSETTWMLADPFLANGNPEKPVCALLFDSQTIETFANATRRHGGNRQVCPSRQH
jgi:nucleolar complex protein 3